MVWAIVFPSEFNEFSPRGDFRGYKEALAAHYKAERRPGLTPRHPPQYVFTSERPVDGDGNPCRTNGRPNMCMGGPTSVRPR